MEKNVNIEFNNLSMDSSLSKEEYVEYLLLTVKPILEERFSDNAIKQMPEKKYDRINLSCPYCGDSLQSDYKKRGNFILKGKHAGYFKCHNCGIFKKINNFFNDFKVQMDLSAVNYLSEHTGDFTTTLDGKYDMSVFLNMDELDKYAIDRQELLRHFGLMEVKDSPVWSWLSNRHQFQADKFLYHPEKNYVLILNLTQSGKILGAQKRVFKGDNRFQTFRLSKLYELMERKLDVEEQYKEYLDTLSMVFNICLINFNKKITLFEGPMDAFLLKNSIANTGANKELPIDLPVRYFYDYDDTGIRKSIEHLNKEQEVFLWSKFINELNLPYRKKWDWNDFIIYAKQNNLSLPSIDLFFSSDPIDIIDI
jgi:hypothetical protein